MAFILHCSVYQTYVVNKADAVLKQYIAV